MLYVRRSQERGAADHGWLKSRFTFSFAEYNDPRFMGFSNLRVINDDRVAPGGGFPTHAHKDMEIVTYVLEGALSHKDSMGNGSVIEPGDVQRMSAGTGVRHSEMNASAEKPVHFMQIWIFPKRNGIAPGYEQKRFDAADKTARLRLVASPDGADGSVTVHSDAKIFAGIFDDGDKAVHPIKGRKAWVHVARGRARVNGQELREGDAVGVAEEAELHIEGAGGEVLVFDLPE